MISEKDLMKYTFTSGAYIKPFFREDIKRWIWVVSAFEDDTYCGGELISPDISSETILGLNKDDYSFEIGDVVNVEPQEDDDFNAFQGTIKKFKDNFIVVTDQDYNAWDVYDWQISKVDEN